MRMVSLMTLAILMTGFVVLAFNVRLAQCEPRMIIVPDDYATIQDAVGNASAGDTIFVRAGTYYGHIEIGKPLRLEGENNQNTTVKLLGTDALVYGIHVTASNVKIEGFNFTPYTPQLYYYPGINWSLSPILVFLDGRAAVCTDNTIENNVLADQGSHLDALAILDSSHNMILNNTVQHNRDPNDGSCIYLSGSDYNVISYNTVAGGWAGIELDSSDHNTVLGNDICNQTISSGIGAGIELMQSSNNVVIRNTLTANELGVSLLGASSNLLYHNNFIENSQQVYVSADSTSNAWDNGYPDGGNYWDDYNGTDFYSGPYQNITGGDGIGDTSYAIISSPPPPGQSVGVNNTDPYPLMSPVGNGRITGDVNMDGHVDGSDMALVAESFGSYGPNYLYPGSLPSIRWNPDCDINRDGVVDGSDLILVALNFGK
jgi:parallel beta-helix repeat protein